MKNPWTEIPAEDYEGHMKLPEVHQLEPLREIFKKALEKYGPRRIAILGCATGNGIEAVEFSKLEKLYALDINPGYLEILRKRHAANLSKIETMECDLNTDGPDLSGIHLIFAALIFEYVDVKIVTEKIARWLAPGGILVAVLQLPCEKIPEISPSPYKSIGKLATLMKLVAPEEMEGLAAENGLGFQGKRTRKLDSGKEFLELSFRKPA